MKLYHDPFSAPARAVRCFMLDEGIPCDEHVINLMAGDHLAEGYEAVNPNRQVPVLVDGHFRLGESAAILKYLADKYHSPAYPDDLRQRARVNEAMDWFNTGFLFNFCYCLVYTSILPVFTAMNAVSRADIEHMGALKSRHYLGVLDRHMLAGHHFLCGDDITIADYHGAALANMGTAVDFDFGRYPNVSAWLARMADRPGWEPAFAAFNGFVAAMRAEPERMKALLATHP
jgi:glutathione S-transferase